MGAPVPRGQCLTPRRDARAHALSARARRGGRVRTHSRAPESGAFALEGPPGPHAQQQLVGPRRGRQRPTKLASPGILSWSGRGWGLEDPGEKREGGRPRARLTCSPARRLLPSGLTEIPQGPAPAPLSFPFHRRPRGDWRCPQTLRPGNRIPATAFGPVRGMRNTLLSGSPVGRAIIQNLSLHPGPEQEGEGASNGRAGGQGDRTGASGA